MQQSKVIKHNTNLKILRLYGNNEKSAFFNHSKFGRTLSKYDIICATPECIYRYFTFGYLNRNNFELILIDECQDLSPLEYNFLEHIPANNRFYTGDNR